MSVDQKPPIPRAFVAERGTVDGQTGLVLTTPFLIYFRNLREDIDRAALVLPDGTVTIGDGNASVAATAILTPSQAGLYSFQYASSVNTPDGVSSSLTTDIDWTQQGNIKTKSFTAMNGDTTATTDSGYWLLYADAGAPIRYTLTYASNTPGQMHFSWYALVSGVASE